MPRTIPEMPNFASEAEEAEWWNSPAGIRYAEHTGEQARSAGVYLRPKAPVTTADLERLRENARLMELRPISIRLPEQDIADAKAIAEAEGIGYQVVLKQAARAGLDALLAQHKLGSAAMRKPARSARPAGTARGSVARRVK